MELDGGSSAAHHGSVSAAHLERTPRGCSSMEELPYQYHLVMTNIAMENGPFIDGLPINSMVIFHGYVSHNQRVRAILSCKEKHVPSCSLHGASWLPPVVRDLGLKMAEDPTESFPLTGNSLCNDQHG